MEQFAKPGDFCPNEACPDYGKLQHDQQRNIQKFGKTRKGVQRFRCTTCGRTFTETTGTIFYRKRTPQHEILETLALLAEGSCISSLSRAKGFVEVYGVVPEYSGRGRPPTHKKPGKDWLYLQMVKQRDEQGHFEGVKLQAIFGMKAEWIELLGESTAYIERSNLTNRLFNGRQVRKSLAFLKNIEAYRAAAAWEDRYYNLVRPHKSLRLPVQDGSPRKWSPRTPAMAAGLTDHIWTVKELLTTIPLKC